MAGWRFVRFGTSHHAGEGSPQDAIRDAAFIELPRHRDGAGPQRVFSNGKKLDAAGVFADMPEVRRRASKRGMRTRLKRALLRAGRSGNEPFGNDEQRKPTPCAG